jgi:Uma2 family endonuclease
MDQAIPKRREYTVEEYLRSEAASLDKHEYRDGEILDMAGGTGEHSAIAVNVIRELSAATKKKPCTVFESNLQVRVDRRRYSYPDVSMACDPIEYDPATKTRTLLNPRLIIEVLSESTESADRGEKFFRYMQIESLQEYVLVAQDRPRVEVFYRHPQGMWAVGGAVEGLDGVLKLKSAGVEIPLAEIYARVVFAAVETVRDRP